ncbi:hypothetical protein V8G54_012925, partial [Vigna mungo]
MSFGLICILLGSSLSFLLTIASLIFSLCCFFSFVNSLFDFASIFVSSPALSLSAKLSISLPFLLTIASLTPFISCIVSLATFFGSISILLVSSASPLSTKHSQSLHSLSSSFF